MVALCSLQGQGLKGGVVVGLEVGQLVYQFSLQNPMNTMVDGNRFPPKNHQFTFVH
jgi:hypothetical protein